MSMYVILIPQVKSPLSVISPTLCQLSVYFNFFVARGILNAFTYSFFFGVDIIKFEPILYVS
jgi:hypothetical protein